jgi:hypothetical protein
MKRQLEAVHVGRRTQPRPHRRRGRPFKNLPSGAEGTVMAADIDRFGTPTSLVPEVEGTVWSGIRATGGLAYA